MRFGTFCLAALALVVSAGTACGGLIVNGNFEAGNTGFTTEYTYTTDLTQPRTIVVGFDPQFYNPRAVSYRDHTSGHGNMLIANGATEDEVAVWEQTVSVTPNTDYVFCYWISTWSDSDIRLAELKCTINGVYVGLGWGPATPAEWNFVFHRWNSGSNTEATIRLVNRDRAEVANDFAIDDIDMFDIGDNYLLVMYSTRGGRIVTPGEGVFIEPPGTVVDLEAQCYSGYEFAGWGGGIFDTSQITRVEMTTDRMAIARFAKLDYGVTMQASGAVPNEFTTCDESADRLTFFEGALEASLHPAGLVVGERHGVCYTTFLFPILKPRGGIQDITRIAVNVYGSILSAGAVVKVGENNSYTRMYYGDFHQTFTGKGVVDLVGWSEDPVAWVPVRVTNVTGNLDLQDVYLSYDCLSISPDLLRRFHDHLSIYRALESYAGAQDIRDLFTLRANPRSTWEAIVQTSALAQDLGGASETLPGAIRAPIEGLAGLLARWRALRDSADLTSLARCNPETIVTCLDAAVASGRTYITAYADAVADGSIPADEAAQLNRSLAQWRADLVALNATMTDVFRALGDVQRSAWSTQAADTAEKMIRAMTPWRVGEPDDLGFWIPSEPTYLDEVIHALQDLPAGGIVVP